MLSRSQKGVKVFQQSNYYELLCSNSLQSYKLSKLEVWRKLCRFAQFCFLDVVIIFKVDHNFASLWPTDSYSTSMESFKPLVHIFDVHK